MRPRFRPLRVTAVERLTDDAAAVTFEVPAKFAAEFAFVPGQSLTVRRGAVRRSYSICAPAGAMPRVGVREVERGEISGWLVHDVRVGDVIDVLPPAGRFTPDLTRPGHHVAIAAGSGITPVLSIMSSVLAAQEKAAATIIIGNRRAGTVMFGEDLADLKDRYPARLQLIHVLSREQQEVALHSGRLDPGKLRELLPATVEVAEVDAWWLCGPLGLVTGAIDVLTELGVDRGRVHRELFYVEDEPPPMAEHVEETVGTGAEVTVILDGRRSTSAIPPGVPILDGLQRTRPDLPFACKGGVCGTCRARLVAGEVRMRRNYALEDAELARGYVLTCQSVPITDAVTVDYDG